MAKKAKRPDNGMDAPEARRIVVADGYGCVDELFQIAADDVATKIGKQDVIYTETDPLECLPLPSLAMRYLMATTGLLFGKLYQLAGIEATYKSTMAAEWALWHRYCGGRGVLCAAESKDNDQLRNGLFDYKTEWLRVHDCGSANTWQKYNTFYVTNYKKQCSMSGGPGRTIPFALITDSITGKATDETIKQIMETGSAGKGFPDLANMLTKYCQAFPQMLMGWPINWIGVNHLKKSLSIDDPEPKIPGGQELYHQSAAIIEMSRGKTDERSNCILREVSMRTIKNTYGQDKRRIRVSLRIWDQKDAEQVVRTYCRWEWWAASIELLHGDFFAKAAAERIMPKIKEIVNIQEKSGGNYGKLYYASAMGVTKDSAMPAHDLGMLLESRLDLLKDLYAVLGVTRRTMHAPSVAFISRQFPALAYHAQQEQANIEIMRAQAALGAGQAAAPILRPGGGADAE